MAFLTEEQVMVQTLARDFAKEQIAPFAAVWDKSAQFPKAALQTMGKLGLMGMLVPNEWDGAGVDHLAYCLAIEEIAACDGACSTIMAVHNSMGCLPILNFGSETQKQEFLKPLARGECLAAFCLTEPQAGSDAAALNTRAEKKGDYYIINGVKQFITSGKNANIALVFAVTDPKMGKKGLSAFIVPTNTPGYIVARVESKMGQHASDTAQIVFENLKIPIQQRLGQEGEGYKIALSHLEGGRMGIAAQSVGMARHALEIATEYAKQRQTFGKKIADHQAVAFRLADMATNLQAARLMTWHAARLRDANVPCQKEAAMAKLFATEAAEKICSAAIQILGGYGYLQDFPVEQIYRDVRVTSIYEGTSDIQRLVIGREIAGE